MLWSVALSFALVLVYFGLSFVSLRTHNAQQAAALSGMAQCIGYLLAATGPILAGTLHSFLIIGLARYGYVLYQACYARYLVT